MTPVLFLTFCLAWFSLLAFIFHRHLDRRTATLALGGLALWLLYASTLAYNHILNSPTPPPRLLLLLLPMVVFIVWLIRSPKPLALVRNLPLRLLIGLQSFRVLVEIFLDELWKAGTLPKGMTWNGHNFDILTGVSAFLIYLFWNKLPKSTGWVRAWNYMGLALVAQVAVTGVLSAPGPQHMLNKSTPNLAILTFPYVLVAALFVISAVSLHILALRRIKISQLDSFLNK